MSIKKLFNKNGFLNKKSFLSDAEVYIYNKSSIKDLS